jgi:hypothetical protein
VIPADHIASFRDEVQQIDKEAALPLLGMLGGALAEQGVKAIMKTRTARKALEAVKKKGKDVLKERGLLPVEVRPSQVPKPAVPRKPSVPAGVFSSR